MANNLTGMTLFVDTAFATGFTLQSQYRVKHVVWSEQVAAGDELIIKDRAGRTILQTKAVAANTQQVINVEDWVDGIQVPTLTSGKVNIYLM